MKSERRSGGGRKYIGEDKNIFQTGKILSKEVPSLRQNYQLDK